MCECYTNDRGERKLCPPCRAQVLSAYTRGDSAHQIAERFGMTRNSIIGIAYRAGVRSPKANMKSSETRQKNQTKRRVGILPPNTKVLSALPRPGLCKFPLGDPGDEDFGYCGEKPKEGSSYCAYHHKKCYMSPAEVKARKKARPEYYIPRRGSARNPVAVL